MAWVRIDELYCEHPKLASLGKRAPAASWLQLSALSYCNRHLTDGRFPRELVDSWWPWGGWGLDGTPVTGKDLAASLIGAGIWKEDGATGEYIIHDYLDYQPSRADVLRMKKARAKAGRVGGSKRQANRQANQQQDEKQTPSKRGAKFNPDPDPGTVVQEPPVAPQRGAIPMRPAQLRRRAEDIRARSWLGWCKHDPPCDGHEACIGRIVDDLRARGVRADDAAVMA